MSHDYHPEPHPMEIRSELPNFQDTWAATQRHNMRPQLPQGVAEMIWRRPGSKEVWNKTRIINTGFRSAFCCFLFDDCHLRSAKTSAALALPRLWAVVNVGISIFSAWSIQSPAPASHVWLAEGIQKCSLYYILLCLLTFVEDSVWLEQILVWFMFQSVFWFFVGWLVHGAKPNPHWANGEFLTLRGYSAWNLWNPANKKKLWAAWNNI